MGRTKQLVCALLFTLISGVMYAQNNTNSPYTRYGYGQLSDQHSARSKAMGGVSYALRDNSQINFANPASYTAMDSLTFMFEGGMTFQNTNFSDGDTKLNAKNSSFDYLVLQFRLKKWAAMSMGVLPVTNRGYNFSDSRINDNPEASHIVNYKGSGGLHRGYMGFAINPMKRLSVGANVSYLWGTLKHDINILFPNSISSNSNTYRKRSIILKGVKLDFGAQYILPINERHELTFGAVYSPKLSISNDIEVESLDNTLEFDKYSSKFDLPTSYGLGVAYNKDKKLLVALDVMREEWSKARFRNEYSMLDQTRVSVGAEYLPALFSRNYFATIKYRVGFYYSTPYYKINNQRAAKEFGVSAGFGIPIPKVKSQLNISAQYVRVSGKTDDFLSENHIRINLGLVFNERWFFKRKI